MNTYYFHLEQLKEHWPDRTNFFNAWYLNGYSPPRPIHPYEHLMRDPRLQFVTPLPTRWNEAADIFSAGPSQHIQPHPNFFAQNEVLCFNFRYLAVFHYLYLELMNDFTEKIPSITWPTSYKQAVALSKRRFGFLSTTDQRLESSANPGRIVSFPICKFLEVNVETGRYYPDVKLFPAEVMMKHTPAWWSTRALNNQLAYSKFPSYPYAVPKSVVP